MKYTLGSSAPSNIFHNQHKTLNNLYLYTHFFVKQRRFYNGKTTCYCQRIAQKWLGIGYSMFVLVMEYIRGSGAPECIFHNKHKTLYNLFSPDQAVSCVGFTS